MFAVDNCLISDDVRDICFCCNLKCCKGECCVEGDLGAPLEEEEISLLEDEIENIFPYMTPEGVEIVKRDGVFVPEANDSFETPLIDGKDCAYLYYESYKGDSSADKVAKCSIETAYKEGKISFNKPISCHLYPIRLVNYGDSVAVNYNRWEICDGALKLGREKNIKIYQFLKEPLIRRFGVEWYDKLEDIISKMK